MPNGDKNGPRNVGSKMGRAAGFCAGYAEPGYRNWDDGRGGWRRFQGRGFWRLGRGIGRLANSQHGLSLGTDSEKKLLFSEIQELRAELDAIHERLDLMKSNTIKETE